VYRPREFPPRGCAAMTRVATLSLIVPCALLCAAAAFGDWPAAFSSLLARSVFAGCSRGCWRFWSCGWGRASPRGAAKGPRSSACGRLAS
jgi:hypothetical protein